MINIILAIFINLKFELRKLVYYTNKMIISCKIIYGRKNFSIYSEANFLKLMCFLIPFLLDIKTRSYFRGIRVISNDKNIENKSTKIKTFIIIKINNN